jgi:hypothetical protein
LKNIKIEIFEIEKLQKLPQIIMKI